MSRGGAVQAQESARGTAGGLSTRRVRHPAHVAHGRTLAQPASGVWSGDHDLQSVPQVVPPRLLARHAAARGRSWMDRRDGGRGQNLYQDAPLRPREERGPKNQAIDPSRSGSNRKVHVLSDTFSRPAVGPFTPGQQQRRENRAGRAGRRLRPHPAPCRCVEQRANHLMIDVHPSGEVGRCPGEAKRAGPSTAAITATRPICRSPSRKRR